MERTVGRSSCILRLRDVEGGGQRQRVRRRLIVVRIILVSGLGGDPNRVGEGGWNAARSSFTGVRIILVPVVGVDVKGVGEGGWNATLSSSNIRLRDVEGVRIILVPVVCVDPKRVGEGREAGNLSFPNLHRLARCALVTLVSRVNIGASLMCSIRGVRVEFS